MDDTVVIKGFKSGIILVLDPDASYEKIKKDVAAKFKASTTFFGEAAKAISFKGYKLSDNQKMEIIDIIQKSCNLSIPCIMEDDPEIEEAFRQSLEKKLMEQNRSSNTGQFYKGNLRSGQVLDVETSIIIIGDVKPGAKVISKGNVIILGSLKGNVYAGASGNINAFVVALDMQPVQIRIADKIARAPDTPDKTLKNAKKETKIAFLDNEYIYIEPLGKDVMSDIHL